MSKIEHIVTQLANYDGPTIKLMEVCGTHTSSIIKNGIRTLISPRIKLCSGPGCPVCVTDKGYIDCLYEYALKDAYRVASFGDMLKVPGYKGSLADAKAKGGHVELFYTPFEVVERAQRNPQFIYVVAAVGFETTTPIYALMLEEILNKQIKNIKFLTSLKCMKPVLEKLNEEENTVDGFIAPGHVSAIMGSHLYEDLAQRYGKPFAVTGFTAEEVLMGILDLVLQLRAKKAEVHNLYPKVVKEQGNSKAQQIMNYYFEKGPATWRGIGVIEQSGLYLKDAYAHYDLGSKIMAGDDDVKGCECSQIIRGKSDPVECIYFGKACTPTHPVGPCMVSGEGVCSIWLKEGGYIR